MKLILFLPFIAAVFWGLYYTLLQKLLHNLGAPVVMLIMGIGTMLVATSLLLWGRNGDIATQQIYLLWVGRKSFWLLIIATCLVGGIAQLAALKGISAVSATYAAMGEIAYPLFVMFFSWVLFRNVSLGWMGWVGGALIFLGAFLLLKGQTSIITQQQKENALQVEQPSTQTLFKISKPQ